VDLWAIITPITTPKYSGIDFTDNYSAPEVASKAATRWIAHTWNQLVPVHWRTRLPTVVATPFTVDTVPSNTPSKTTKVQSIGSLESG